jgi:hypothetical protein
MAKRSSVTGGKQIAKNFRQIVPGLAVPLNEASRKALAPMLTAARANAPVRSGALKRSLAIKRRPRSSKIAPVHVIGPRVDFQAGDERPIKYAHIVEFGRAPNADGQGGLSGTRFLTRAFEATADAALQILKSELPLAVERRVKKLAAKGAR